MILNFTFEPRGVTTSTVSPFLRPMIALPTGDSFESLRSAGFASAEPDDEVLGRLLRVDVTQAHDGADRDDARVDLPLVDDLGVREALLELGDAVLEHHLLVLRVVVLGVLGDLAELARSRDALGDLAALLRAKHVRARPSAACEPSGVRITSFTKTPPETRLRGLAAPTTAEMVATPFDERQTAREYHPRP